ncbi:lytic transglycosylase domain-containing protein [Phenylobacterium hankyongense]|uniref:Lytic transglycosylase domain-containing protein n=1 Tax=Phenylobacterium hankyongense TaxID=1813876 RepID=A0A328B1P1_9CAUL|nr:lytic transglycosylase domain-containing protein [Phenylobacterium hankyongense]RAK61372.1 lytic transglycosylase domain-containing protein [Phenylobacterium hankyongense]
MTLTKRLQVGASVLVCAAAMAFGAAAQAAPQALSTTDAQHYAAAFDACDRGDFIDAEMQTVEIKDKSLLGYVTFQQLMHPTAHKASFDELSGWLAKFRDLPLADRIFQLASKRKPADAGALPTPTIAVAELAPGPAAGGSPERARQAREAFYAGDAKRALELAPAAGDRWIAGLAAYRLKAYDQAQNWFGQLARDGSQDAWLRSAAAYWGSRAATALGDNVTASGQLRLAAQNADTFYGMIAERQLRLQAPREAEARPLLIRAAYVQPSADVARLIEDDPRAHRAAALVQIGRAQEAGEELRAGLSLARTPADRSRWTALAAQLGGAGGGSIRRTASPDDYPLPSLEPKSGFTIDKALVYAIVRQESRFNPMAVSPVGAVGLMQLMPEAAARAAGDDKLKADMSPLFDPAFNLRVGQDYVTWLMERGVGYDLLRTVAAYNGGPNTILKTAQMLGGDADSLLLIESLPSQETRNYVEKVMAGYWTYKKMFGEETPTLDAVAGGRFVDARLDLTQPTGAGTQLSAQPLQVGMQ